VGVARGKRQIHQLLNIITFGFRIMHTAPRHTQGGKRGPTLILNTINCSQSVGNGIQGRSRQSHPCGNPRVRPTPFIAYFLDRKTGPQTGAEEAASASDFWALGTGAVLAGNCNSIHAITSSSDEINSAGWVGALWRGNISWIPWTWTTRAACLPF